MTRNERTEYIDKVVVIGYSWLSEENYQCPLTIYNLLTQLDLNKKEKERVEGLKSDTLAVCKNKETLKNIVRIKPNKIIYMSCNPITFIRDMKVLNELYAIKEFYLLNMFSRTSHFEVICYMEKNK